MSRIGDLRANEENNLNLVKVMEVFSGGETKYVEMLLKLYKTIGDALQIKINTISARTGIDPEKIKVLTESEIDYLYYMCDNSIFVNFINNFNKFREYNEQNLIENKDLHSYKRHEEVIESVREAHEKIVQKEFEKSIEKLHEDKEWLILIPLTYESSVKYGYNTKWCTSSDSTSEQYKSYTRDGVLIYIIHKGKSKTAAYKRIDKGDISFWNQKDDRIDSLQCDFPPYIMNIVSEKLQKANKPIHDAKDFVKDSKSILQTYNTGFGVSGTMGHMSSSSGYGMTGISGSTGTDYTQMSGSTHFDSSFGEISHQELGKSFGIHYDDDRVMASSIALHASLNENKRLYNSIPPPPIPNFNDLMQSKGYLDKVKDLMRKLK